MPRWQAPLQSEFLNNLKNWLMITRSYPSDDINKFLWMVRIGGGVFPDIKEKDYLGEGGYRVDDKGGKVNPGWFQVSHRV